MQHALEHRVRCPLAARHHEDRRHVVQALGGGRERKRQLQGRGRKAVRTMLSGGGSRGRVRCVFTEIRCTAGRTDLEVMQAARVGAHDSVDHPLQSSTLQARDQRLTRCESERSVLPARMLVRAGIVEPVSWHPGPPPWRSKRSARRPPPQSQCRGDPAESVSSASGGAERKAAPKGTTGDGPVPSTFLP